jgi:ABC-type branched-subunit amino acid transport system substrate-binding protein
VLVAGLEADCLFAATTLRGLGCRATLLGTDAVKPSHVLRATGFPAPYLTNSAADARHRAPEFHRRFEASHGRHHSVYTVETYDVTRHLVRWLAANPNATRAEASSMLRTPFDGLAGPYTFGPNGDRTDGEVGVYRDESSGLRYLGTASDIGALVGRSAGT